MADARFRDGRDDSEHLKAIAECLDGNHLDELFADSHQHAARRLSRWCEWRGGRSCG